MVDPRTIIVKEKSLAGRKQVTIEVNKRKHWVGSKAKVPEQLLNLLLEICQNQQDQLDELRAQLEEIPVLEVDDDGAVSDFSLTLNDATTNP